MALAKAECTCKTCGQKFEFRAYKANRREADSFEAWAAEHINECEDCAMARKAAERAKENEDAARIAAENDYPQLIGTEKQVAWAITIREQAMKLMREYYSSDKRTGDAYKYNEQATTRLALSNVKASWWIDHREATYSIQSLARAIFSGHEEEYEHINAVSKAVNSGEMTLAEALAEFCEKPEAAQKQKTVRPEAVPEARKHDGSVDITVADGKVTAVYAKDETFREIVKELGFVWSDAWIRTPSETAGTAENIIAELGSKLLNRGFAVRFDSQDLLDKAVSGDYTPMCRRWIKASSSGFGIVFARDERVYSDARALPGAKYEMGTVYVPERSWQAILGFADKHGFRLTASAQEKMDLLSGAAVSVVPTKPNA